MAAVVKLNDKEFTRGSGERKTFQVRGSRACMSSGGKERDARIEMGSWDNQIRSCQNPVRFDVKSGLERSDGGWMHRPVRRWLQSPRGEMTVT